VTWKQERWFGKVVDFDQGRYQVSLYGEPGDDRFVTSFPAAEVAAYSPSAIAPGTAVQAELELAEKSVWVAGKVIGNWYGMHQVQADAAQVVPRVFWVGDGGIKLRGARP